jgi:hypothetical protein
VVHPGNSARYAMIASLESGPELDTWIERELPQPAAV